MFLLETGRNACELLVGLAARRTLLSNAECTSRLVKWTSGALVMICINIEYVFVGNKTECSRIFGGPGGPPNLPVTCHLSIQHTKWISGAGIMTCLFCRGHQHCVCFCWRQDGMLANFWRAWRPPKRPCQRPNAPVGMSNGLPELES